MRVAVCTEMDVTRMSLSQPGDRGGSPAEGQTSSSNDRPASNACLCPHPCVCVSQREQEKRQKAGTSFISIYLFISTQATLCINRQPICMHVCTILLCPCTCMCVCVAECVMRCLYDKHKASLRGILIRGFATVVMETALSSCISQWR